jgi:ABC-type multidrug transport system fused ATPase/permease subunit
MAVDGIKPYIWGRIWILGLIIVAVYIVLTIFCNTKINYRLSNKKNIKIEKIESVMVDDNCNCGSAEESQHEEQKVTFTYNGGKARITENYNLNSSRQEYFYNKLVKEKEYYTLNVLLIILMSVLGVASFLGSMLSLCDFESFNKCATDLSDWREIYRFKSGIIKQLMIFCGYTDMDRVAKAAEKTNPWRKNYDDYSYRIPIPSYREIWKYFKELHEKVDEPKV